jgi:hypothetical protein
VASGIWDLRTAERQKRISQWPSLAFNPAGISGLQVWFDASDASTLYDATSGGSLVAADGAVKRWEDKSGNARHATEGTNAPQRKTASINSLDALLFDGSNDRLAFSGNIDNSDGHVTVFAVARRSSTSGIAQILNKDNSNVSPRTNQYIRVNDANVESIWFQSGPTARTVLRGSISANTTFLATVRIGASEGAVSLNGFAGTPDANVSGIQRTNENTYIGDFAFAATQNFNGNICEIIAYNSALSDTDKDAVESYLMTKWGIS